MSNGPASTSPRPHIGPTGPTPEVLGPARSGRRFVVGSVVAIAVIWGTLAVVFRDWKARHRALAEFGAREVATAVDPLADRVPPGVDTARWRRAVDDTREMLRAFTASGALDRPGMERLSGELRTRFARTTPETAVADLAALWDEMRKRDPFLANPPSRPPFAPARPKLLGGEGE